MLPSWDQVSGAADRVIIAGLMWLAGKGYISQSDVMNYGALVLGIAAALYGFWVNRQKALAQAAANAGMQVVAPASVANAIPSPLVQSRDDVKVVAK